MTTSHKPAHSSQKDTDVYNTVRDNRVIHVFKRIAKMKWLPWLGMAPFFLFALVFIMNGQIWKGLAIIAFFGSSVSGIYIGPMLGRFLNTRMLKWSTENEYRLSAGLAVFAFLFLPALVGFWSNAHLETDVVMSSLGTHFAWACAMSALAAITIKPEVEE